MLKRNTMGLTSIIIALLFSGALNLAAEDKPKQQVRLETKIIEYKGDIDPLAAYKGEGALIEENALKKVLENKGVDILSAPTVCTLSGQEALICIQSELQYFEAGKNDSYVLKQLPDCECPGIRLKALMKPVADEKVELKIDFRMNTLENRIPIEGVALDVGKPIMQTSTVETELTLTKGGWFVIARKQLKDVKSGALENVVILARVTISED